MYYGDTFLSFNKPMWLDLWSYYGDTVLRMELAVGGGPKINNFKLSPYAISNNTSLSTKVHYKVNRWGFTALGIPFSAWSWKWRWELKIYNINMSLSAIPISAYTKGNPTVNWTGSEGVSQKIKTWKCLCLLFLTIPFNQSMLFKSMAGPPDLAWGHLFEPGAGFESGIQKSIT